MTTRMVTIGECAVVLPGFSFKGTVRDEPDGTVQVISAQHLNKDEPYVFRAEHQLRVTPPGKHEKYLLKAGDILFMSRGSSNYATLLEDIPTPAIASLTFHLIKCKEVIFPGYLAWCLNQAPLQRKLNEIRVGAGTPMIPRGELEELEIPLPGMKRQREIYAFAVLQRKEETLLKELTEETKNLHRMLGRMLWNKGITKRKGQL